MAKFLEKQLTEMREVMKEIQGQCLRLVNNDKISIYEELTDKAGLVFIHQGNIWGLLVVLFKIKMVVRQNLVLKYQLVKQSNDLRQSSD